MSLLLPECIVLLTPNLDTNVLLVDTYLIENVLHVS